MPVRQKHVSGHVIRKGGCPEINLLRTIKTGLSNRNILLDITNLVFLLTGELSLGQVQLESPCGLPHMASPNAR